MLNLTHLRMAIASWLRHARRVLDNLLASLKQTRENLHQSFRDKQGDVERQIHEILVDLRDWQRIGFKKAIQILKTLLAEGTDRQIKLQMCRIVDLMTHRWSVGSLHPIRGAYKYLSAYQESLVWRFIAAFEKWFSVGTQVIKEAVADLDATLDTEPSDDATDWAINEAGEAIQGWMPYLIPQSLFFTPVLACDHQTFVEVRQDWGNWKSRIWKAVSKFKQRFEWARC